MRDLARMSHHLSKLPMQDLARMNAKRAALLRSPTGITRVCHSAYTRGMSVCVKSMNAKRAALCRNPTGSSGE
eukprot:2667226-Heterocapsa_arctica.AAC.1